MEKVYQEIIDFILSSGKRIAKRAGNIQDIGVKKKYLTEEDIAIERGMKEIIKKFNPQHELYAEEENDAVINCEDLWIADPISGTKTFIEGLPNYGIVIAYTKNKIVQFAAAYDPSVDELFTAYIGKGAFLNGKKISVSKGDKKMIFNLSSAWKDQKRADELLKILSNFDLFRVRSSFAISLCHVACGRYDGIISLCKDSFPIFAGSLMIQEAGGVLTNERGDSIIDPIDRVFIGGNKQTYEKLLSLIT